MKGKSDEKGTIGRREGRKKRRTKTRGAERKYGRLTREKWAKNGKKNKTEETAQMKVALSLLSPLQNRNNPNAKKNTSHKKSTSSSFF